MNRKLIPLFLILLLSQASCKNTWDPDDKDVFRQACMEDAVKWAGSEVKANTYCDCVLQKVVQKFPNESDALEHIDSVIKDPDVRSCKATIAGQP